jgi:hypothetical protein
VNSLNARNDYMNFSCIVFDVLHLASHSMNYDFLQRYHQNHIKEDPRSHLEAVSKHKAATVYQCTLSTLAISHASSSYMTSGVVGPER